MTLRKKLVVLIVTIVFAASAAIGAVLAVSLKASLFGQLDEDLRAASSRSVNRPVIMGGIMQAPDRLNTLDDGSDEPLDRFPAGQAAGTINVTFLANYVLDAGFVDENGDYQYLSQQQFDVLNAIEHDNTIVELSVPDIGEVRAISAHNAKGYRTITAIPTADANEAFKAFVTLEFLLIAAATALAGGAGFLSIKRALRPLDSVAQTATHVSELPLAKGEVTQLDLVPDSLTDESTEVGKVGSAFNRMLGHVQSALAARHSSETQVRQFVADASHELRTPLASIRGYAELIRRSPEDIPEGASAALARIESESIRMTALVEDLLLLAHLDAGREIKQDVVDLSMLSILTLSDAHAAGPRHVWNLDLPDEPCEILGDESRLQQVLVNLLANARVHTPEGTIVTLALSEEETGYTTISVSNNGPRIPHELMDTLFQRFSRGDNARNRNGGSTGLGLAIAHAIVTAHGGTITVRSDEALTEFVVRLPQSINAQGQPEKKALPPVPPPPS